MSVQSESLTESRVWTNSQSETCCKPVCRMRWFKNKGAVLVVLWTFLVTPVYYLLKAGLIEENETLDPLSATINSIIIFCTMLLFPVGGWIADARLGRYKTVRYSMWMMWIAAILATLGEVVAYVSVTYNVYIKVWVFRALCVVMMMGLGGFQSNIIQLGTDQLIDASANEISSFILWYALAMYGGAICFRYITACVVLEYKMFFIQALYLAISLTVALCCDYFCKYWLFKEEVIRKSISDILKVVRYIIKKSKLRYNFATSDEDKLPSQFDIAKHQYGGPFTAEQVDNVRTCLWILAILATCGVVCGSIMPVEYAREEVQHRWSGYNEAKGLIGCYRKLTIHYEDSLSIFILALSYEFIIRPFFYRCLPKGNIVSKFIVGTVLLLLLILSLLNIEVVAFRKESVISNSSVECIFDENNPKTKVDRAWFLIPDILNGISHFILVVTAIEFIWAQTPSSMKGLMFGSAYVILGLSTIFHGVIAVPFLFKIHTFNWYPLSCGIWYFIMEGAITLAVLIGIMVLVKIFRRKQNHNPFDTQSSSHFVYSQLT